MPIKIDQLEKYDEILITHLVNILEDGYTRNIELLKKEFFLTYKYIRPSKFDKILKMALKEKKIILIEYTGNVFHYSINDGFEFHDRKYKDIPFANLPFDNELY